MSFLKLKFLSLACLSLAFLTNVMANCVDLTGVYQCPMEKIELLYSISQEGAPVYFLKNDEGTQTLVANDEMIHYQSQTSGANCDAQRMMFINIPQKDQLFSSGTPLIGQVFKLSDNEEKLIIDLVVIDLYNRKEKKIADYTCYRI